MTSIALVNPLEYFKGKVNAAAELLNIDLDDQIEFYLVNLLCDFIDPSNIVTDAGKIDLNTPLALMLKNALESNPNDQVKIYKKIGDTSLYYSGYFQDHFNRKTVNIDYYISMGSSAYVNVSSIMRERHRDEHFTLMYSDLAREFDKLVDLIAKIAEEQQRRKDDSEIPIVQNHGIFPRKKSDMQ